MLLHPFQGLARSTNLCRCLCSPSKLPTLDERENDTPATTTRYQVHISVHEKILVGCQPAMYVDVWKSHFMNTEMFDKIQALCFSVRIWKPRV